MTLGIAESVWQESWAAREAQDPAAYEASTCAPYIQEETARRRATSTADLLAAFEESKKYRPPWSITDHTLIDVDFPGGNSGRLRTEATVTDNRNVPPTTDRRTVEYDMKSTTALEAVPGTTPLG
ncbi:hypothetical protein GS489_30945 [Rhodococcus hoagii]|nr:hypothetical protein [Prescottella equi]